LLDYLKSQSVGKRHILNKIYTRIFEMTYASIRDALEDGSLKLGQVIPLMTCVTPIDEDDIKPSYEALILTQNYEQDLRAYFERMSEN